ncbi:MAG TPA: sulfite exporter TauE/SafE family protein [Gemmatimonadaceae bacterium]|nr:sulfite exporter TauE/SafE family protein [Gemmatimonadaceae bacterium]
MSFLTRVQNGDPIAILVAILGLFTLAYLVVFVRALARDARNGASIVSAPMVWVVSFVANFFDTLGVGSYATTTSMMRFFKLVPDERIPGSLNVGYVIPTVTEAFLFIYGLRGLVTVEPVQVDPRTLISLIAASILGAWLGAGVVASWPRRKIQIGMGLCLLAAAIIMVVRMTVFQSLAVGTTDLSGARWIIGLGGLFILGALMTLGIGLYAPCLILVTALGMSEKAAFPIMMGACAFLMPVAVVRFIRAKAYYSPAMLGMAVAGVPAVLLALKFFQDLSMTYVKVLVICVVTYTSVTMLRAARRERVQGVEPATVPDVQTQTI